MFMADFVKRRKSNNKSLKSLYFRVSGYGCKKPTLHVCGFGEPSFYFNEMKGKQNEKSNFQQFQAFFFE